MSFIEKQQEEVIGEIRINMDGGCHCKGCEAENNNIGENCSIRKSLNTLLATTRREVYKGGYIQGHLDGLKENITGIPTITNPTED